MTGVFLQVRTGSTRLPGKALLPLGGVSITEQVMQSLLPVKADIYALLTDKNSANDLKPLAKNCGFELFTGPEHDVLARYARAVDFFSVDTVIRATGDNPLVSVGIAETTKSIFFRQNADYCSLLGPPLGCGTETVSGSALLKAYKSAKDPYEREHVCPYLYRRPENFHIVTPKADEKLCMPDIKVSIDTQEDYRFIKLVYSELYEGEPIKIDRLVSWLKEAENSNIKLNKC